MGCSTVTTLGDPAKGKSERKRESLLSRGEVRFGSFHRILTLKASFISDKS